MASASFEWIVYDERLQRLSKESAERIKGVVEWATTTCLALTLANIRAHKLIDTGFMLSHTQTMFPLSERGFEGQVIVGAEYAIYHEYGTVRLPAKPFLGPAVESVYANYANMMMQALEGL
jgi:HK97 gp10 family phage protein